MNSLVKFFSSVKLAITLIIIITCASIVGSLIPQQRSWEEYASRYGELSNILNFLQLTRLYQSEWFIGLLFLFALNIIICTLNRFSPKLKRAIFPKVAFESREVNTLKIKDAFKKSLSLTEVKSELRRILASKHYRLKEAGDEKKVSLLARKKVLGLFGSDIVHLGILVILAGGIASGLARFSSHLTFVEGQVVDIPEASFKIRMDKFETEYYPNGNVKDWKSTLTVLEKGGPVLSKAVEVNHPLSYQGFVFYQTSYGWNWPDTNVEILLKKESEPSFSREIRMKVGEKIALEGEGLEMTVLHFIPDFVINDKDEIMTRSLEPNNPAAFIEGWKKEEKIFSGWLFAKFPDFSRIHSVQETDLSFELKDFQAGQFSVIQASKDPGVNIIWVGSAVLMAGLFLALYWPIREIKVVVERRDSQTEISAGGIATKNHDAFKSEFQEIMTSIRRIE